MNYMANNLARRVCIHNAISGCITNLRRVAHTVGVALASDVTTVNTAAELTIGLFGGAIFWITQNQVTCEVAKVVRPPVGYFKACRMETNLRTAGGGNSCKPVGRTGVG